MTDAFGVVALVALTPLIAIQVMGILYQYRLKTTDQLAVQEADFTEVMDAMDDIFEFEEGSPCMELYGRTCDARMRIAERTGLDFEDRDLLEIVECMEEIAKICGLKMYEYGIKFGHAN